jgi:hypothetical protein
MYHQYMALKFCIQDFLIIFWEIVKKIFSYLRSLEKNYPSNQRCINLEELLYNFGFIEKKTFRRIILVSDEA